jgi:hypothetical protein
MSIAGRFHPLDRPVFLFLLVRNDQQYFNSRNLPVLRGWSELPLLQ